MKIAIVGTGYVGLVTGTCFAETGATVYCIDIDATKIENLKKGIIPIYEPGLDALVNKNVLKEKLFFTTDIKDCISEVEIVFIAVGTPPDEDGSADLTYVLNVAHEVGKHMQQYLIVVTKSTVPIGTAKKVKAAVQEELNKRNAIIEFDVASNPEFLKEGNAIEDFLRPDRIVIGVESEKAEKIMSKLYKPYLLNNHPIFFMDIPSAEMTKYAANSMLATKISFMNDLANLCEIVGADINLVRKGIGSDTRIGSKFIYAGAGYGGSCFPKDVKALIHTSKQEGHELRILKAVEEVNNVQKEVIFNKIKKHFKNNLQNRTFALWGLSFKPQTDDMRDAPSLVIIKKLLEAGARVSAYDPVAMKEAKRKLGDKIKLVNNPYEALPEADGLIIMTEWNEFRLPDFSELKKQLKQPLIFDGRNIYELGEMQEQGFTYYSIGRKDIMA
jgi:UDPglucose 6-dehydrogenase